MQSVGHVIKGINTQSGFVLCSSKKIMPPCFLDCKIQETVDSFLKVSYSEM